MNTEVKRQILHILSGILGIILIIYHILTPLYLFFLLILGGFISLASLKYKVPLFSWFLENFERKDEKIPGRGLLLGVAGALLALKLFSFDIALASITILTFADSSSHLVGQYLGKIKFPLNRFKNLEGLIFGVILGTLFAMFFVSFCEAFLASAAAMFIEAVEIKISEEDVDDNLIIPVIAGTIILLFRAWF